jgi:DNA-binding response OmpR family regulator
MTNQNENTNELPLVLLVDDTRVTADIDKSFFVNAGFRVLLAASPVEVNEIVARHDVHLVMVDVSFAKEQGLAVMQQVRKFSRNKNVKVLVTTIVGTGEMRASVQKAGADGFLVKPAPTQKVLKEVKALTSLAARDSERIRENLNVTLKWAGKTVSARSLDLSEDGIHLTVESAFPEVGTELELNIFIDDAGSSVAAQGKVVRHTKEGFGVRFEELGRNAKRALDKFILAHSLESRVSQYYL